MTEQTIPAGTIVKIGGFPFELTADTKAMSATPVETACMKSDKSMLREITDESRRRDFGE